MVEAYCLRNRLLSEIPQLSSCFNSQTNETYTGFDRLSVIQYLIAFGVYACVCVCFQIFWDNVVISQCNAREYSLKSKCVVLEKCQPKN